jgi:predicted HAD superfamily hydrolase
LNVGGTHNLMSSRKVLCSVPGSTLEKMFSGLHKLQKIDDRIFVDRDGHVFEKMLNYLRNDRNLWPEFKTQGEV